MRQFFVLVIYGSKFLSSLGLFTYDIECRTEWYRDRRGGICSVVARECTLLQGCLDHGAYIHMFSHSVIKWNLFLVWLIKAYNCGCKGGKGLDQLKGSCQKGGNSNRKMYLEIGKNNTERRLLTLQGRNIVRPESRNVKVRMCQEPSNKLFLSCFVSKDKILVVVPGLLGEGDVLGVCVEGHRSLLKNGSLV